jgi:hypothetical protein
VATRIPLLVVNLLGRTESLCFRAVPSDGLVVGCVNTVRAIGGSKDPSQRVVITGMGVVSAFGNDVDTYYDRLLAGESAIKVSALSQHPVH